MNLNEVLGVKWGLIILTDLCMTWDMLDGTVARDFTSQTLSKPPKSPQSSICLARRKTIVQLVTWERKSLTHGVMIYISIIPVNI